MEFCVVSTNYRTEKAHVHVFLDNIVVQFVDRGHKCNVIAPQSFVTYFFKKNKRRELVSVRKTKAGNEYTVYSPPYLVFPKKKFGKLCLADWTRYFFYKSIEGAYKKYKLNADVVYSHFIQAGTAAVRLGKKLGVPSFIANGEADTPASMAHNSKALVDRTLIGVSGIISVSTKNKDEIEAMCGGDANIMKKVAIIPNAVDSDKFYKKDKLECRKKLGFPEDKFIVAFTGSFIERKGVLRLAEAIDRFDDVYSVFIGTGAENPECKNILYKGRVENSLMIDYLNAADAFVLPTLAEGCSNAIVEGIACGLPVISADLPFNYDILDETNSIMLDPMSVDEIAEAIGKLKNNRELCETLAKGSEERAKSLTIDARAEKILAFIDKIKGKFKEK